MHLNIEQKKKVIQEFVYAVVDEIYTRGIRLPISKDIRQNVFYVNGTLTYKRKAKKNVKLINNYFNEIDCQLIFSPGKDLINILHDRNSLKKIVDNLKEHKDDSLDQLADRMANAIEEDRTREFLSILDDMENQGDPIAEMIDSPVIETMAFLQIAKNHNAPIGLIASSHGTLVSFNALLIFSLLHKDNLHYLKNKVHLCLIAPIFKYDHNNLLEAMISKYESYANEYDRSAQIFYGERSIIQALFSSKVRHNIKWYLPVEYNKEVMAYYKKNHNKEKNKRYDEPFVKKNFFTIQKKEPVA